MNTSEGLSWHGHVQVIARFADGTERVDEFPNLITSVGKTLLAGGLAGSDTEIKYVALGSSNTAVAVGQTALGSEQFRKVVSTQTAGATGVMTTTAYIAPAEGLGFTIEEIGWFGGSTATATAGTGIMLARVLYTRAKSALESLQITRTDTVS